MKKLLFFIFFAALASGAYFILQPESKRMVKLISVERGNIDTVIRVTGKVINDRTVKMTSLVDGQITEMPVNKGEDVRKDQVLTALDRREAEARLSRALAELEREKQTVKEFSRKVHRLRQLSLSGGTAEQALEDADSEQRTAQANLKVAEAVLEIEKIHSEKIEVKAPFNGIITEKTTEVGQWVEAGTELFTLVAHQGREIEVLVDAGDSATVKIGQSVTLNSDAWPDIQWTEKITRISPAIKKTEDEALNTFAVRISLGKDAPQLLLGQQMDARIHINSRKSVLTLPFDALVENDKDTQVAVVRDGKVAFIPIKIGIEDFSRVEIVDGINEGDQVILLESNTFSEGEVVEVSRQ